MTSWNRSSRNAVRRGALLMELLVTAGICGLIALGIQAAMIVSLKGLPKADSSAALALRANRIVDRLATELETAIYITERSSTAIGFTVPDRDGDGRDERIRYAWTGSPGGALTWQYNGASPVTVAASVDLFSLTPTIKSVPETIGAMSSEDSTESLLIDYYGTTGTANNDVTASTWFGQYFTMTLPAGATAWRPTRVQFMGKSGSVISTTRVQMRPADALSQPTSTILEEYSMLNTALSATYAWRSVSFSSLAPIGPGGGICLVLQHQLGLKSMTVQSSSAYPGLLKTTNTGSSWTNDGGKCLVCQLYGKLTRGGGTQTINSNYLTSMGIVLRLTSTSPTLRTTAATLNYPELLSGKWELKFTQNPTTTDVNGDGAGDWNVNGGGTFNMTSISNNVWQASDTLLNTNPGSDFAKTTIVDLRFRNTGVGGDGAKFSINAFRGGLISAPVMVNLQLQNDGTQTLTLATKTLALLNSTLISVPGLPNQPVDLHLVLHPATSSVSIRVNDVQRGTFALTSFVTMDNSRLATIGASGSNAEFSYARIRVLE
ncbi:MAG: hypothetical protein Q8K78_06825 [Planctomycetaceae bacterium]|nr:hypothetical protein [Planctomycetaceae bacterium]